MANGSEAAPGGRAPGKVPLLPDTLDLLDVAPVRTRYPGGAKLRRLQTAVAFGCEAEAGTAQVENTHRNCAESRRCSGMKGAGWAG